ncbi:hypothetical protein BK120_08260 [Paenibacillus sp. FSL A5-0031]|uniref:hypothetical protein n=1 Tax=Paenibacillus sp. FSL A5-0031 TaxID=1920420 RepID=UPI00096EE708|nr:hypothetical protein [Paenibacillus sp. FSL A5-0031]OME86906.1 hypothetical protein BK120_08260 [Paenibacillus sp. FSL A5-0031]
MKYNEWFQWIERFPLGKQILSNITSIIPEGSEKAVLINVVDQADNLTGRILISDDANIISLEYILKSTEKEQGCSVDYRRKGDIVKKTIELSDVKPTWVGDHLYSSLICTLHFANGEKMKLNNADFSTNFKEFHDTVIKI